MAQKGNIGVTTENIFPVIKKFLYSDCHILFSMNLAHNVVQDFRQSGVDVYCVGKLLCSGSKVDKS